MKILQGVQQIEHRAAPSGQFSDEDYVDIAGFVGKPFRIETGDHFFETLGANGKPDWRKEQEVGAKPGARATPPVLVTLEPVQQGPEP